VALGAGGPHGDPTVSARPDVAAAGRQARDVALAGQAAAAVAFAEWLRDVRDLPDDPAQCALITRYLRATKTRADYPARDSNGHPRKWCGDFWAWCWHGAATGLHEEIRDRLIQSTYRLMIYAGLVEDEGHWPYMKVRHEGATSTMAEWLRDAPRWARKYARGMNRSDLATILPGDLLTVSKGRWGQGGHITLALGHDAGRILTIEGNSTGPGPTGERREGVVMHCRKPSEVRLHLRPSWRDLLPGVEYLP